MTYVVEDTENGEQKWSSTENVDGGEDEGTAEQTTEKSGMGGWWQGWIQAAKNKSADVMEFVKKDIDEFTQAIQTETNQMVSSTAQVLKNKLKLDEEDSTANAMKQSVSGFFSHVTQVFAPDTTDDEDDQAFVIANNEPVVLSRLQAQLYSLVRDPNTFLLDPEDMKGFDLWNRDFDLDNQQDKLSDLMINNPEIRSQYTKLVPAQVSHVQFWLRVLFRMHQLEESERQRAALRKRADQTNLTSEEAITWDDDEDFGGSADIPEEVQDRLLADFQKECEDKKSDEEALEELRIREKGDMVVVGTGNCSSSSSHTEKESLDEWDKASDADILEEPSKSSKTPEHKPGSDGIN